MSTYLYDQDLFLQEYPAYRDLASSSHALPNPLRAVDETAWQRTSVLYVPRGVRVASLIDLNALLSPLMDDIVQEKIIIIVEDSASVSVCYGSTAAHFAATIQRSIHCIVHENASLKFNYDEVWPDDVHALTEVVIEQKQSTTVYYTHSARGGAHTKQWLSVIASGKDAHADIRGSYEIINDGGVEMTTLQYHDAMHTKSNLLFKGIVRDTAQMKHHGTIVITQNGAHTESAQHTHTLLLSNGARAISVPNIEVSTHEVQCGHGSAIGRLDEEQLWYLQSRGLSYAQAEQCLIDGFFNDVL